jgi:riboflavin synthase
VFTGIIEETGTIRIVQAAGLSSRITISASTVLSDMKTGDSINTNGVCLTVTEFTREAFTVDVMPETMQRTAFRTLRNGSRVNLERALRITDRLGGHIVSGHIDGTGSVERIRKDENAVWITLLAGEPILRYVVEKGSIAVDGVSLTVARVYDRSFEVSVIPHTRRETTLMTKKPGDLVNLECDIIGKYIEKFLRKTGGKLDMNFLAENGFI